MNTPKLDLAAIREIYPSVRSDGDAAIVNTLCDEVERLRQALDGISVRFELFKDLRDERYIWDSDAIAKKALES